MASVMSTRPSFWASADSRHPGACPPANRCWRRKIASVMSMLPEASASPRWKSELGTIDLFFHDSLHTAANMRAELELAWRHLSEGGFAVADDVFWNRAFWRFAAARRQPAHLFRGMGLTRKPAAGGRA